MPSFTSAWAGCAYIYLGVALLWAFWKRNSGALLAQSDADCEPWPRARTFSFEGRCFHVAADNLCHRKENGAKPDGLDPVAWCWAGERNWNGIKAVTLFTIRQLIRLKSGLPQLQGEHEAWIVAEAVGALLDPAIRTEDAAAACGRIGELLQNAYASDWIISAGAIDAVVAASSRMLHNKTVVKSCAGALTATCRNYNLVNHASMAQVGGFALLQNISRQSPEDATMLMDAALKCYLRHGENKLSWLASGGVELMLKTARAHFRDPDTLARVLSVLDADKSAPSAEHFIKAGGFEFAVEAIRAHPPPKGGRVGEMALQTVRTVLYQRELRETLAVGSYISDVVQAMRGAAGDYYTLSQACSNLMLLCLDNSTHLAQAIEEGAPLAALSAVVHYPDTEDDFSWDRSPEITERPFRAYEDCLQFLRIAVRDCGARKALNEAGAVEAISSAMPTGEAKIRLRDDGGYESEAWPGWLGSLRSKLQEEPCAEE